MLIDLEKRIVKLEDQVGEIKTDLATLTVRSEQFATKEDVQALRAEMYQAFSGIHKDFTGLLREISNQTKWMTATILGVAAVCMTTAKFLF